MILALTLHISYAGHSHIDSTPYRDECQIPTDSKHSSRDNSASKMSGGLPTSPFEVESTKDIIQKHIDAGTSAAGLTLPVLRLLSW